MIEDGVVLHSIFDLLIIFLVAIRTRLCCTILLI